MKTPTLLPYLLVATVSVLSSTTYTTTTAFFIAPTFHKHQKQSNRLSPRTRAGHRVDLSAFSSTKTALQSSILDGVEKFFQRGAISSNTPSRATDNAAGGVVRQFLQAYDTGDIDQALSLWKDGSGDDDTETIEFDDVTFYNPLTSKSALERRWRLQHDTTAEQNRRLVIDNMAVDSSNNNVGVKFHYEVVRDEENDEWIAAPNGRVCAFFQLSNENNGDSPRRLISRVLWVMESTAKSGEAGLQILNLASKVLDKGEGPSCPSTTINTPQKQLTAPEKYFDAWNRRNMDDAVSVFSKDVVYDDTAFPQPFAGKEKLRNHLLLCADCFPPTFQFVVDNIANDKISKKVCVEWHVENNGAELPFTRGCSFYVLDRQGLIQEGTDFVEPAVVKPGLVNLFADSMKDKFTQEPIRFVPLAAWIAYMYIVFFSDGILPGANALQLETRTWEEVRDLSLNFFLVAPLLNLPFAPTTVHPMLEGVFNLLLSWAALFAGFLSDDRKDKPNWFPMLPAVVGMQFLTSAFFLPYLALRTTETRGNDGENPLTREELPLAASLAGESRLLGPAMGIVGTGSIAWFFNGRVDDYGSLFSERWTSFIDLLSIDRVGSSFLVDLAIFGLFQHWLVDDDMKRRLQPGQSAPSWLVNIGKFVPFFGLVVYLTLRPPIPSSTEAIATDIATDLNAQ